MCSLPGGSFFPHICQPVTKDNKPKGLIWKVKSVLSVVKWTICQKFQQYLAQDHKNETNDKSTELRIFFKLTSITF